MQETPKAIILLIVVVTAVLFTIVGYRISTTPPRTINVYFYLPLQQE